MTTLLLPVIYLIFISLGLPDAMFGSAWPTVYPEFDVPVSYAGAISMIIAFGTVVSSLLSDRMTLKFGTGKVTAASVALTCIALFGFSTCSAYWMLCLWAIPYGLGAGGVDASINNYVAIHYESRHMSWLHCMWGVGTTIGPFIMGSVLSSGQPWSNGYRTVSLIQLCITAIIIFSLPLWKSRNTATVPVESGEEGKINPLTIKDVLRITGAKNILFMFFCYSAIEQTAMLWGSSYLVLTKGIDAETAANFASMFCIGITVGRFISGFITMKLNDISMIRLGQVIILIGVLLLLLPVDSTAVSVAGLILTGLGCAPIYPCVIHSTPEHFGEDKSQAIIGMQMAFAYMGTVIMPALFGVIANNISASLFPAYLLIFLILMFVMHEQLIRTLNRVSL